jgi:putative oxidoreductase
MKIFTAILRTLFGLFLLIPVAGVFNLLPQPTAEMYTPQGWAFISALMQTGYMMPLVALTSFICGALFLLNHTALAAVLLAPFTVNVIAFHWFLDAAPVSASSIPAYILLALNIFFLWINWGKYRVLWKKA